MTKNIPSKWDKIAIIIVCVLSLISFASTWVSSCVPGRGPIAFGAIFGTFLVLALAFLFVILFVDGNPDHKKYSYIFGGLAVLNLLFFILGLCFFKIYAFPIIQTFILAGIIGFGVYFWIKSRFTFRTKKHEDKPAPTTESVEPPKNPEQPKEPEQKVQPVQQPQQETEQPKEDKPDIVSI